MNTLSPMPGLSSRPLVIAVDGPAASGKGTLAKKIADALGLEYLDTGAIYRAVGLKVIRQGIAMDNEAAIIKIAASLTPSDLTDDGLYAEGVGMVASIVSAIPEVRQVLFSMQRDIAQGSKGAVLDGRDIGTVICPDADFKFYITANIEARAERRYKQLQNQGKSTIYKDVLEDLQKRDDRDSSRAVAPMMQAEDAIHIDTTDMDAHEVLQKVLAIIRNSRNADAP